MKYIVLPFLLLPLVFGCTKHKAENQKQGTTDCRTITSENADDCLRLNEIQVLGTHNSYKLKPADSLIERLNEFTPGWATGLEYSHRPLPVQLEELGIRKFELDIFADTAGGLFSEPKGAQLIQDEKFSGSEEMMTPGFKVLHVQDVDYRGTCRTLINCLQEIKGWSDKNPNHLPVMIMLEMKGGTPGSRGSFTFTEAIRLDEAIIKSVDDEIWSVFSNEDVITPDDVREEYETLEQAILDKGWPTLKQSRGKVLFALDNTDEVRDMYLSGAPSLEGSTLFVSSRPGNPSAAFIKMNDVFEEEMAIKEYSRKGYIIRTRADIPTVEARSGDTTRKNLALQSGAHYISTDYPEPSPFDSTYIVRLPGTKSAGRCNPVSAPSSCKDEFIKE